MNYIIVIAIVICLLIIGFSYFSSKHVNTIKENFSVETIKSPCYESDIANCDNDTCMTASVYKNFRCEIKENEKCSNISLDDCISKNDSGIRDNPGCRVKLKTKQVGDDTGNDNSSNTTTQAADDDKLKLKSKCFELSRKACYDKPGCIYDFNPSEIDGEPNLLGECKEDESYLLNMNDCNNYNNKPDHEGEGEPEEVPLGETCKKLKDSNMCRKTNNNCNVLPRMRLNYRDSTYFSSMHDRIFDKIDDYCRFKDDAYTVKNEEECTDPACDFYTPHNRCYSKDKKKLIDNPRGVNDFYQSVKTYCQSKAAKVNDISNTRQRINACETIRGDGGNSLSDSVCQFGYINRENDPDTCRHLPVQVQIEDDEGRVIGNEYIGEKSGYYESEKPVDELAALNQYINDINTLCKNARYMGLDDVINNSGLCLKDNSIVDKCKGKINTSCDDGLKACFDSDGDDCEDKYNECYDVMKENCDKDDDCKFHDPLRGIKLSTGLQEYPPKCVPKKSFNQGLFFYRQVPSDRIHFPDYVLGNANYIQNDSLFCAKTPLHLENEKCFPYQPENKKFYSASTSPDDTYKYKLPFTFFESIESTRITLNTLPCEEITELYHRAKALIKDAETHNEAIIEKRRNSSLNIIKVVEEGDLLSVDGSKKCLITTDNVECYNKCDGLSQTACATEQVDDGECIFEPSRTKCLRSECFNLSDNEQNCKNNPKCNYTAEAYDEEGSNICIPKIKCGEGEELKISATTASTGYNEFKCEPCPKGYYEESNICKRCPVEKYTDNEGSTECLDKTQCNYDTQYISAPVIPELPDSLQDRQYLINKITNNLKDKFDTKRDRTCVDLTKCDKLNDKYVENKDYSITPELNKLAMNFYYMENQQQSNQVKICEDIPDVNNCGVSGTDYEHCIKDDDNKECKEPDSPLIRYSDYSCDVQKTCNENQHITNYQEMIDNEFDSMFTMDLQCKTSSNCNKGTYEQTGRFNYHFPKFRERYTQDRECLTCPRHSYTDNQNMTECIPQPTLGLGFGSVDYDPSDFESKTGKMEYQSCLEDDLFQDTPAPHREPCKTQQIKCTGGGKEVFYREYSTPEINCLSEDEPYPASVCEITKCVDTKNIDARQVVGDLLS
jgi:hypothetical protein